jgi:hypothetical protein
MKWARKVNNFAVDVRTTNPEGCYTEQIVAEFIVVPDEVQNMWVFHEPTKKWMSELPQPTIKVTRV